MTLTSIAHAKSDSSQVKKILQRPLIIGASVSGDFLTPSPGKRLALNYTSHDQIRVIARNGKPAREVLKAVDELVLKDRTAVIGVDLFFWDSFGGSLPESLKSLERIQEMSAKLNLPLVLGEVPQLSPQFQPHAASINKRMHELCKAERNCKILPLNSLLRKVIVDGHVVQKGVTHTLESLLPDGLHIGAPASEYLADRILEVL